MIYVKHRQNKIFNIKKLNPKFGAEIDESYKNKL